MTIFDMIIPCKALHCPVLLPVFQIKKYLWAVIPLKQNKVRFVDAM